MRGLFYLRGRGNILPESFVSTKDAGDKIEKQLLEKGRLAMVDRIRTYADGFYETRQLCPLCRIPLWEAVLEPFVFRGCGCATLCFSPRDILHTHWDEEAWIKTVQKGQRVLAEQGRVERVERFQGEN
jgi:hypothetical protein